MVSGPEVGVDRLDPYINAAATRPLVRPGTAADQSEPHTCAEAGPLVCFSNRSTGHDPYEKRASVVLAQWCASRIDRQPVIGARRTSVSFGGGGVRLGSIIGR
ncbi:hypothetical protein [Pseudonocardia sp. MH-G8]|uniref:hypothetical protein n=1 Tax=Pseudonocardia sp. MH-G8 TaxID=1854588 RepID=UPI00117B0D00|nr:hypothetical protein [Pseudonocardia sp. MH-G8]